MLSGDAGQAVAGHAAEIGLQLGVIVGGGCEELVPGRAVFDRRRGRDLGHAKRPIMIHDLPGAQVDDASGGIQQPRIAIPTIARRRMLPVGTSKPFDRGNGGSAGDFGLQRQLVTLLGGFAANEAGKIESPKRRLPFPPSARSRQPLTPRRDIGPVAAVAAGELKGQRVLGDFRRLGLLTAARALPAIRIASALAFEVALPKPVPLLPQSI